MTFCHRQGTLSSLAMRRLAFIVWSHDGIKSKEQTQKIFIHNRCNITLPRKSTPAIYTTAALFYSQREFHQPLMPNKHYADASQRPSLLYTLGPRLGHAGLIFFHSSLKSFRCGTPWCSDVSDTDLALPNKFSARGRHRQFTSLSLNSSAHATGFAKEVFFLAPLFEP